MTCFRILVTLAVVIAPLAFAAGPDGAALYKLRCAACHDISAETRAPAPAALKLMSPENIVHALDSGVMKEQGASLTPDQRRTVAEYLTGKIVGSTMTKSTIGICADPKARFHPEGPAWNGWGADLANTRFESAAVAGIVPVDVGRLKLKWSFGYPIHLPRTPSRPSSADVSSWPARIAWCIRWTRKPDANTGRSKLPRRSAPPSQSVTIKGEVTRSVAFFGDRRANAYAVDASSGEMLWKTHIDDHRTPESPARRCITTRACTCR